MDYGAAYTELHGNLKYFPGYSIGGHAQRIKELVERHNPESLLDYGCGKGYQYLRRRVHEAWGGLLPHCYDVGLPHLCERYERKFDGVICTDMLEHIEEQDVAGVIADICGYANKFVFCSVDTAPAVNKRHKLLPDGRNPHLTVKPREWWEPLFEPHRARIEVVAVYG